MNPAFSVIFLTTLIGVGQGLFIAIVFGQSGSVSSMAESAFHFEVIACGLSLGFLILGLFASFFHLGHPERAWRAVSQWKTSWLSREVIVLPMVMLAVTLYGGIYFFRLDLNSEWLFWLGWIGVALVLTLFICTAMIYACIKFIQEWSTPLTVINYCLLGCASGFMLAAALASSLHDTRSDYYASVTLILITIGFVTRLSSLYRNKTLRHKSTIQTAIGVKHRQISQRSQGFMGGSFNTRDFFHHCSQSFLDHIKWISMTLVFLIPAILISINLERPTEFLLWVAFTVQYLGLIAERWLFFAQANHPQNLYYQTVG